METSIDRLKGMVNRPYLYRNEEVVIISFCDAVGDDGDLVEIYLNNGRTIEVGFGDLGAKLNQFVPITKSVIVLANQTLSSVSSINPGVLTEVRDTTLDMIRELKRDPSKVNQAKQIFQGINTLTNLAKVELEYRKYIDSKLESGIVDVCPSDR